MPKYFYTDPLKAAWMAREFGVEFQEGFSARFLALDAACQIRDKRECNFYYIHPDSLHILGPKVGDLYVYANHCRKIWENKRDTRTHSSLRLAKMLRKGHLRWQIIQRNGKAFFMPEVEE